MATYNKKLHSLTKDGVERVSEHFLLGWRDLEKVYGFRLKGLNNVRAELGMEPLTNEMSDQYRLQHVRGNYSDDEIFEMIVEYIKVHRVDKARWEGIELFGCRFGREYARLFKELVGAAKYRQIAELARRDKSFETQNKLYGGVGLAGEAAKRKAVVTVQEKYGVSNVMKADKVKQRLGETNLAKYGSISPFGSHGLYSRVRDMKCRSVGEAMLVYKKTGFLDEKVFKKSSHELAALHMLCEKFGANDVYYEYGIHPSDPRYPFSCDFHIKSIDLFLELNGHYTHGGHWFDPDDHDDQLKVKHWLEKGTKKTVNAVRSWTVSDPLKRETARKSGIKYLVFWDGQSVVRNKQRIPRLSDFRMWLYDYDADYEKFIKDHPENTY